MDAKDNFIRSLAEALGDSSRPLIPPSERQAIMGRLQGSLAEKLNAIGAMPETSQGKVVTLNVMDDSRNETALTDEELNMLGIDPSNIGYIDQHPEGSDRGGNVEWVFAKDTQAYWMENDGKWRGGN